MITQGRVKENYEIKSQESLLLTICRSLFILIWCFIYFLCPVTIILGWMSSNYPPFRESLACKKFATVTESAGLLI